MPSNISYILLRKKTNLGVDDPSYAGLQNPAGLILFTVPPPGPGGAAWPRAQVEIVIEWRDVANAVVANGDLDRGSFDMQAIKAMPHSLSADNTGGLLYVDSETISGVGFRPIEITDARAGDQFGVRLTNIAAPVGATQAWIYVTAGAQS